jgi:hypothetical protein
MDLPCIKIWNSPFEVYGISITEYKFEQTIIYSLGREGKYQGKGLNPTRIIEPLQLRIY